MIDEKGVKNWNRGLEWACCHGHMNVVKLMIEHGANNLIPLSLPEFIEWIPEEELLPFYNLPHLSPVLKEQLNPRVDKTTKEILKSILDCEVILPDIVRHILLPYIRK
jgi:Ankyrin repeat.